VSIANQSFESLLLKLSFSLQGVCRITLAVPNCLEACSLQSNEMKLGLYLYLVLIQQTTNHDKASLRLMCWGGFLKRFFFQAKGQPSQLHYADRELPSHDLRGTVFWHVDAQILRESLWSHSCKFLRVHISGIRMYLYWWTKPYYRLQWFAHC
jgi:hypothetical protein